jgi:hypothetical protein
MDETFPHDLSPREWEAMFFEVDFVLGFIPFEFPRSILALSILIFKFFFKYKADQLLAGYTPQRINSLLARKAEPRHHCCNPKPEKILFSAT